MPLSLLYTTTLLKEIPADGNSPMKFLCKDGHVYYCKYRSGKSFKEQEIDCLAYEIVCHFLLQHLQILRKDVQNLLVVVLLKQNFYKHLEIMGFCRLF